MKTDTLIRGKDYSFYARKIKGGYYIFPVVPNHLETVSLLYNAWVNNKTFVIDGEAFNVYEMHLDNKDGNRTAFMKVKRK